jgi:hypothetical protein
VKVPNERSQKENVKTNERKRVEQEKQKGIEMRAASEVDEKRKVRKERERREKQNRSWRG